MAALAAWAAAAGTAEGMAAGGSEGLLGSRPLSWPVVRLAGCWESTGVSTQVVDVFPHTLPLLPLLLCLLLIVPAGALGSN